MIGFDQSANQNMAGKRKTVSRHHFWTERSTRHPRIRPTKAVPSQCPQVGVWSVFWAGETGTEDLAQKAKTAGSTFPIVIHQNEASYHVSYVLGWLATIWRAWTSLSQTAWLQVLHERSGTGSHLLIGIGRSLPCHLGPNCCHAPAYHQKPGRVSRNQLSFVPPCCTSSFKLYSTYCLSHLRSSMNVPGATAWRAPFRSGQLARNSEVYMSLGPMVTA